ncbi:MAG: DUF1365 domain-containing protein [Alphaproteobacteria bacterium]|nr:DUF1365 domain-containing protein [Alphaproteobacteria bacterium]
MDIAPQIYTAKVMHKRLFPKINQFTYGVYYLALPLPAPKLPSRLLSFHEKDHGARDGSSSQAWARNILVDYGIGDNVQYITLVTMPRVLGYVFNPVSFFLCLDDERKLRAVICEVHNTFSEQHSYLCARADHAPISPDEWLSADKLFHVSPFLPREGNYKFRFALAGEQLGIWIDYYDKENNKQLITTLTGKLTRLNATSLRHAFWSHPLVTFKVITLIHWQAVKLMSKGIRYIVKPSQRDETISATCDLTKGKAWANNLLERRQ